MLLMLALVLLSDSQGQGLYGVAHGLAVIASSSGLASSRHTAPAELVDEEGDHQSRYQDQDDTGGSSKVEGDNGLAICLRCRCQYAVFHLWGIPALAHVQCHYATVKECGFGSNIYWSQFPITLCVIVSTLVVAQSVTCPVFTLINSVV